MATDTSGVRTFGGGMAPTAADSPDVIAQGVSFTTQPTIPDSVTAGKTLTVRGTAQQNCTIEIVEVATRVIITIPGVEQRTVDLGKLGCGDRQSFNETFPVPDQPDTSLRVRLELQVNPPGPLTGWQTRSTVEQTVAILSREDKVVRDTASFVPWALGGGAVGVGAAALADETLIGGGLAGAGLGVGAKIGSEQFQGQVIPDFPTVPVLALAALFGTGAVLISTTGLADVGQAAGTAARRATEAARS